MGMGQTAFHLDDAGSFRGWFRFGVRGSEKILLRTPEMCKECGEFYKSLYPLRCCNDHGSLDKAM